MKRAFTLAETIFATFVLALVMMTLFNIFPSSALAVKRGEMQLLADSVAEAHLEQQRAMAFDSLAIAAESYLPDQDLKGLHFKPSLTISAVPGSDVDRLKSVNVNVYWSFRERNYKVSHEAWIVKVGE
ncbi:MAG: hypothetical protein AB7S38_10735 [Vulcanimicrobiota bacterium]